VLLLLCRSSRVLLLRQGQAATAVQPAQLPCLRQGHSKRRQQRLNSTQLTGACMDEGNTKALLPLLVVLLLTAADSVPGCLPAAAGDTQGPARPRDRCARTRGACACILCICGLCCCADQTCVVRSSREPPW
jgi:hypothetical protein